MGFDPLITFFWSIYNVRCRKELEKVKLRFPFMELNNVNGYFEEREPSFAIFSYFPVNITSMKTIGLSILMTLIGQ